MSGVAGILPLPQAFAPLRRMGTTTSGKIGHPWSISGVEYNKEAMSRIRAGTGLLYYPGHPTIWESLDSQRAKMGEDTEWRTNEPVCSPS